MKLCGPNPTDGVFWVKTRFQNFSHFALNRGQVVDHIRRRIDGEKEPNRSRVAMRPKSLENIALHHIASVTDSRQSVQIALTSCLLFLPGTVCGCVFNESAWYFGVVRC
jgi:hypothetical protein